MHFFRTNPLHSVSILCGITLSLVTMMSVQAQDAGHLLAERYAAGSIESNERANAALQDLVAARAAVDSLYADQRNACFDRFFASACLSDVRERKRTALSKIRQVEVEANAFLRKAKAAERDRALAERDERARQQPGGRARPISGVAREPVPDDSPPAAPPADAQP